MKNTTIREGGMKEMAYNFPFHETHLKHQTIAL
jgi:hypothetical protein